jgi:outer membrane protein
MKSTLLFLFFFWSLLPIAEAKDLIGKGETLNLDRCISIALQVHPSIRAATGQFKATESRVGLARSEFYPQISLSSSYSRTEPMLTASVNEGIADEAYDSYVNSISLSQNIYDFGRTSRQVKIEELNHYSSGMDLENVRTQVIFAVKQAYWELLRASRNRDVSREVVAQYQQHLDQARAFFEAGTKPKIDVTRAEVDLSSAKLSLLGAENAYRLAVVALNNAMGIPEAPDYTVTDELSFERVDVNLDDALQKAYSNRPDFRSIAIKKKSLEQSIELVRKGYYPFITGTAGYGWGGNSFPLDRGWNIGAQVTIPLFSGFSTGRQIAEAQANLEVLDANEALLKQTIYQDVKQAWLNLQEAADRIVTAELSTRQAKENLDQATGRYASGVSSPLEVTDALVSVSNAKTSYISALYDYKVAKASMEKAMGE